MFKQAADQLNKIARRAVLRRKLNRAIIENIKNGVIYHASPGKYDILKGQYTGKWSGEPGSLFVTPFKGIAANFVVNKHKILDNIERQLGGKIHGLNFSFDNWDKPLNKLHELPKDITISLNVRGIKPIHGKSTGYLYTIDYLKNKDRAHMFSRNPNSDVEFLIDGDVPYINREKTTVRWKAVPSEDSIKWHGEAKLIDSPAYEPPYNKKQLIENGYTAAVIKRLLADPAHSWRMKTGIELIHRELTRSELKRIWNNWQLMTDKQKALSDAKCMELFGVDNKTLYEYLIPQYKVEQPGKDAIRLPNKQ